MSFLNMKASVMAGLKCEPEILALKISRMKNPQRRPQRSPVEKVAQSKPVSSIVPRNSKRRISKDSFIVVPQSCECDC